MGTSGRGVVRVFPDRPRDGGRQSPGCRSFLARRLLAKLPRQVRRGQYPPQEDVTRPPEGLRRRDWHGVFGGTYMTDVRTANFRHLIRSESRSDALLHGAEPWIAHEVVDFD